MSFVVDDSTFLETTRSCEDHADHSLSSVILRKRQFRIAAFEGLSQFSLARVKSIVKIKNVFQARPTRWPAWVLQKCWRHYSPCRSSHHYFTEIRQPVMNISIFDLLPFLPFSLSPSLSLSRRGWNGTGSRRLGERRSRTRFWRESGVELLLQTAFIHLCLRLDT